MSGRGFVSGCVVLLVAMVSGTLAARPPHRLTSDGRNKRDPVYIDSGRRIIYTVQSDAPRLVLMSLDRKTQESRRFAPQATLPELKAVFSRDARDGRSSAWLRMTGNDQVALLVRAKPGASERKIKTAKSVAWSPSLTPDGRHVVFNLAGQLVVHELSTGKNRDLAKSSGRNDWPAVSPDGRRVAFGSSRSGDVELYVVDFGGGNLRRLTHRKGLDMRPAWSSNGRRLAFTSVRAGNYEISVMSVGGAVAGEPVNVSRDAERDDFAAWHPGGRRLLWVAERGGRQDLLEAEVPVDGGEDKGGGGVQRD